MNWFLTFLIIIIVIVMKNCESINGVDDILTTDTINIPYINSDYLYLEKRVSLLPIDNVGQGVFAKVNISHDTIICEYRGPIISEEYFPLLIDNDKLFDINNSNNKHYKIIGNNICAYINDCTSVLNRTYTIHDIEMINNGNMSMTCFDNYNYNAKYVKTFEGKVFVKSITNINKDDEIFFSYGW